MSKWTHIRVSRETKAALDAEAARLVAAYQAGAEVGPEMAENSQWDGPGISSDALIRWLLAYRQRQRERTKKSRAKRPQ